jgi:hypothetical protein
MVLQKRQKEQEQVQVQELEQEQEQELELELEQEQEQEQGQGQEQELELELELEPIQRHNPDSKDVHKDMALLYRRLRLSNTQNRNDTVKFVKRYRSLPQPSPTRLYMYGNYVRG